jgi:predicted negative regulator of RcsB-dependent stress response
MKKMNSKIIIVLVILSLGPYFSVAAYGQHDEMLDQVLQYCRFVHDYDMNDGKEDIKGDLVDTRKLNESALLKVPKTCSEAKDTQQDMENLKNSVSDAFKLDQMDK